MRRLWLPWLAGVLFLAAGAVGAGESGLPAPLTVLFTGDTEGEYQPCGCPGSPLGGFARRASLIDQVQSEGHPVVVLDSGNVLLRGSLVREEVGPETRRHARFMGRMLAAVGTQAVAVGPRDLWALGADGIKGLATSTGVVWLSANVVGAGGAPVFPSHWITRAGGVTLAVVGLTQPQPAVISGSGLKFSDPVQAARDLVPALRGRADLVVLLCNVPYETQEQLQTVPGVDLVIAGSPEAEVPLISDDRLPCVVRVHGLGRTVARVDLRVVRPDGGIPARSLELEQAFREITGLRAELDTLKALILEEEGRPNPERFEREGAFLRGKLEALEGQVRGGGLTGSVFAYQEIVLDEHVPSDARVARRINAYEKGRASAESSR